MAHDGLEIISLHVAGPAFHLGIAEAVEGEAGFPRLHSHTAQRIAVGGLRRSQRSRTKLTVLKSLGMAQGDGLPGLSSNGQTESTTQVLAEVNNGATITLRHAEVLEH